MSMKQPIQSRLVDYINWFIMILVMIICLYPLIYILFASLSDPDLLLNHRGILLSPMGFSVKAYELVMKNPMITIGYGNTIFYVVVGTAVNLFMTTLGAYCMSKSGFLWKKIVMLLITFTMFFGGGLIPSFLLVKDLGLYDTRFAVIIPGAISTWNLIMMRTYFQSIPGSMEESAKIDGANDIKILIRIILPLSMPIIAVMVLFYGVGHWNDYFNAMIYIRQRELQPIQTILREILISQQLNDMLSISINDIETASVSETIKYATIIITTVPILFIYPFLQKYFVKGIMVGAIKG